MSAQFDFADKSIWVTGAGRGMGARHAQRFAEAGGRVACIDLDSESVESVVEGIRSQGGEAHAIVADVANWGSMKGAAEEMLGVIGPCEIAVANAGIMMEPTDVEDLDVELWRKIVDVDLTGPFLTAKAAIPQLRERGGGSLVLISSISGVTGYPGFSAYNAAKHGVIGLTRTLANELASIGVRVNTVCPGWVDTPMLDFEAANLGMTREEAVPIWASHHLIPRLVQPDEVSDAVLWLASGAASMVTGVILPVDGGLFERRVSPEIVT
jgi:NAD(P)-dependent dehydrogenase (short-subunit alcohol dehydrogenase family)